MNQKQREAAERLVKVLETIFYKKDSKNLEDIATLRKLLEELGDAFIGGELRRHLNAGATIRARDGECLVPLEDGSIDGRLEIRYQSAEPRSERSQFLSWIADKLDPNVGDDQYRIRREWAWAGWNRRSELDATIAVDTKHF